MKILKVVLGIVLVLAIFFFGMGLLVPETNYGTEITVDKTIKEAWAVSQDESKYAQWLEGFKSMELLEGEKWQVGSKHKVVVEPGNGQPAFEMIETITSIKEFEHVEMEYDSDMMDFEQKMFFTETEGKTTIASEAKVIGKNLVSRSMFAIMETFGKSFSKQDAKNYSALKKLIEENTTDYFPDSQEMKSDSLNI